LGKIKLTKPWLFLPGSGRLKKTLGGKDKIFRLNLVRIAESLLEDNISGRYVLDG